LFQFFLVIGWAYALLREFNPLRTALSFTGQRGPLRIYRSDVVLVERFPVVKTTLVYMELLFISIDWMPFLARTLDNADPLFMLVITPYSFLPAPRRGGGSTSG